LRQGYLGRHAAAGGILKLLYRGAEIMIFDEPPPYSLPGDRGTLQSDAIPREKGKTIISSPQLREVMEISDRDGPADGRVIQVVDTKSTNTRELARMMVGREVLFATERPEMEPGPRFSGSRSSAPRTSAEYGPEGASLSVRQGEIVGIAGWTENGQTELSSCSRAQKSESGSFSWAARRCATRTARSS